MSWLLLGGGSTPCARLGCLVGKSRCSGGATAGGERSQGRWPMLGQGLFHTTWYRVEGHKAVGSWPGDSHCSGVVGHWSVESGTYHSIVAVSCSASNHTAAIYIVIIAFFFFSFSFSSSILVNCFCLNPWVLFSFHFSLSSLWGGKGVRGNRTKKLSVLFSCLPG